MTTYYEKEIICAICKNKSTYEMTSSFNAFGSCDLDTRPPEMQRSTMQYWTQRCPDCGYCAIDISVSEENMVEIVKSSKYQNQLKDKSFPKLANTFLCSSLIQEISGSYQGSAWKAIHAAWACDDFGLKDSAKSCRIKALNMIRKGESKGQSFMKSREESLCIQVDLLRRAERFKEASNLIKILLKEDIDDLLTKILHFQKKLIASSDKKMHKVTEAI